MRYLPLDNIKWRTSPTKTEFGDGMVSADITIGKDETLTIYTTKEGAQIIKDGLLDKYSDIRENHVR